MVPSRQQGHIQGPLVWPKAQCCHAGEALLLKGTDTDDARGVLYINCLRKLTCPGLVSHGIVPQKSNECDNLL